MEGGVLATLCLNLAWCQAGHYPLPCLVQGWALPSASHGAELSVALCLVQDQTGFHPLHCVGPGLALPSALCGARVVLERWSSRELDEWGFVIRFSQSWSDTSTGFVSKQNNGSWHFAFIVVGMHM